MAVDHGLCVQSHFQISWSSLRERWVNTTSPVVPFIRQWYALHIRKALMSGVPRRHSSLYLLQQVMKMPRFVIEELSKPNAIPP